jgi:hypothetical protein
VQGPPSSGPPEPPDALPAAALLQVAEQARVDGLGFRLADLDRALRLRLQIAADAAMRRALERAGAKLRTKATVAGGAAADAVSPVGNIEVAATLGPSLVAAINVTESDLLDGAFDELGDRFRSWTERVQEQALQEIQRSGGDLSDAQLAALRSQQTDDRNEAWLLLLGLLRATASRRLYDPRPEADLAPGDPVGELDPTVLVPAGQIRQSISRAGGSSGPVSNGGAVLAPGSPTPVPTGGIATGQLVSETFQQALGIVQVGWTWLYGDPGSRGVNFDPHLDLDGQRFDSWSSPILASDGGWPYVDFYYPGDHLYCQCDFAPSFQEVAAQAPASRDSVTAAADRRTLEGL